MARAWRAAASFFARRLLASAGSRPLLPRQIRLQDRDHGRLIPLGRAFELADDHAVAIDEKARRQTFDGERIARGGFRIEIDREILDPGTCQKRIDDVGAAPVLGDGEDGESMTELGLEPVERRHLLDAGHAPGRPQIDEHEVAAKIGELLGRAVAGRESERGRWQLLIERDKLAQSLGRSDADGFNGRLLVARRPEDEQRKRRPAKDDKHRERAYQDPERHSVPARWLPFMSPAKRNAVTNAAWGGRFAAAPAEIMQRINASLEVDKRLYAQDIAGSLAHCAMLVKRRIISRKDGNAIARGLRRIHAEIEAGKFPFRIEHEDIHLNIEARLSEKIGAAAGRLHTARSRNDQVATDFRLWVRDAIDRLDRQIEALQAALIAQAERHTDTIMPGFTHLQVGQPVTFGHHLLAYVEMLGRDRGRLGDCRRRLNESPLGAGALAGTSFPIDRAMTARALGFERPMANSLDAVSDRDFALEFLAGAAIAAMHLSRFAEEIILWLTEPFRFVRLSDAFTTGSSMMPQKRNPDAAELVRAKAGRLLGALAGLLAVMKGLPLAYAKDMQEDKAPVFDAADTLSLCLAATTGMVRDMKPDKAAMHAVAATGFSTATDLADWLVRYLGLPFRQAHHVTGALVARAEALGCALADLPLHEMQRVEKRITRAVYRVLTVERSVASRKVLGGTAPATVARAAAAAKKRFLGAPR